MRGIFFRLLIPLMCFAGVAIQLSRVAAGGSNFRVTTTPQTPTARSAVTITTAAVWSDGCVPVYQSYQVVSQVIRLDYADDPSPVCTAVITPWEHAVDVGTLPAGTYTVRVYVPDDDKTEPVLRATTTLTVVDRLQFYLPEIHK